MKPKGGKPLNPSASKSSWFGSSKVPEVEEELKDAIHNAAK